MRELTFEEMDQVSGGNPVTGAIIGWVVAETLNFIKNNAGPYIDYWVQCIGQYPAGPYDYHVAGS